MNLLLFDYVTYTFVDGICVQIVAEAVRSRRVSEG